MIAPVAIKKKSVDAIIGVINMAHNVYTTNMNFIAVCREHGIDDEHGYKPIETMQLSQLDQLEKAITAFNDTANQTPRAFKSAYRHLIDSIGDAQDYSLERFADSFREEMGRFAKDSMVVKAAQDSYKSTHDYTATKLMQLRAHPLDIELDSYDIGILISQSEALRKIKEEAALSR